MNTMRNRASVLASFVRGAIGKLSNGRTIDRGFVLVPLTDLAEAVDSLQEVAEVLEQLAGAPDPATPTEVITGATT